MQIIHSPPNAAGPIADLFAFVSIVANGEGICASILPGLGSTPLATGNRTLIDDLKTMAEKIGQAAGRRVRLVRFERAEILWESEAANT